MANEYIKACPKCGQHTVRITDSYPISNQPYEDKYMLDSVITAVGKCDTCGSELTIEGAITWEVKVSK